MKRVIWLVAIAMAAQAVAEAQTQVLSRNAVGYVKITAPRGKLVLGRSDFEAMDGSGGIAVSNLFGDQVPASTYVYLWDRSTMSYKVIQKTARGTWPISASNRVRRGEGFWLKVPVSASNEAYDVFLMGEVPDRFTAPTTTIANLSGANMIGYPYPVSVLWTSTTLAAALPNSSFLYTWDVSNQVYVPYQKTARGQWLGAVTSLVLQPGVGFWIRNTGTVTWVETKPYTWP